METLTVAPPSDKINNSVFHLQNQAKPLHSNAHIFKIRPQICTIFRKIEHRDIHVSCLAKINKSLFSSYKQLKSKLSNFLKPFLLPGSVQCYKIDLMNIILSFKDRFDLFVVLMQNVFEIWRQHYAEAGRLHACETFCQALRRSNYQHAQCLLLFKQILHGLY